MVPINIRIKGAIVRFYVYPKIHNAEARINSFATYLQRMPAHHVNMIDPIFIVDRFPRGRTTGGGYWTPAEVSSAWLGKHRITGVPDEDIRQYVLYGLNICRRAGQGIIGITTAAFQRNIYHFSIMHEIAHSVDLCLGLVPSRVTLNDFRGVRYPKPRISEYAAETYARFIINPWRVCRDENVPRGENKDICNQRLIGLLRRSQAFQTLPSNWMPR